MKRCKYCNYEVSKYGSKLRSELICKDCYAFKHIAKELILNNRIYGDTIENILKIFYLKKYHPHIALFVQTSPAFCCPALITEAMTREIEHQTGIPIVSITYDGTGGAKNKIIIPYLKYPLNRTQKTNTRQESETTAPTGHSQHT